VFASLKNARISTLGTVLAILLAASGVAVVASSVFTVNEVNRLGSIWQSFDDGPATKSVHLSELKGAMGFGGMIHEVKNFVLRRSRPTIPNVHAKLRDVTVALVSYRLIGINDKEKAALTALEKVIGEYRISLEKAENMASVGKTSEEIDNAIKIDNAPAMGALQVLTDEFDLQRTTVSAAVRKEVNKVRSFAIVGAIGIGFVFLLLTSGFVWFTRRRLSGPLNKLNRVMRTLADGDKTVKVPNFTSADEIGDMAGAVRVFKENMMETERLQTEQREAEKRAQDEEARRAEQKRAADARAEEERRAVEARAEEERKRAMLEMADAFEASVMRVVDSLSTATGQMQESAQHMSNSAEQTSRQASAVAAASEEATANVQTVASATEELSASIREISRQVVRSNEIAQNAVEEARMTNAKVEGLAEAAQKIGEVVSLINDIASQTNLLALNATIEAARAGEAGKGFAVVASEFKSLATQTGKATEEIAAQIAAIQGATSDAVQAIQGIGKTIGQIGEIATSVATAVEEQGAATGEIATNVQQAAAGTQEVSGNIAEVTQAASESQTASAHMLDAANNLAQQGEVLRQEVDRFLKTVRAA